MYSGTPPQAQTTRGKRPLVKDQDVCLRLGNRNYTWSPKGRYQVCLTENQQNVLFGGKPKFEGRKKLGCGVFACAYQPTAASSKVIKFTRDASDVAALIEAQPTGAVPKLYRAFKLKQGGAWEQDGEPIPDVYAVEVERLKPMDKDMQREMWDGYVGEATRTQQRCARAVYVDAQVFKKDKYLRASCGVADAVLALDKVGLTDLRDLHGGNMGYDKRGKLKILDLGLSSADFSRTKEPAELAAPKIRRMLAGAVAKLRGKARAI